MIRITLHFLVSPEGWSLNDTAVTRLSHKRVPRETDAGKNTKCTDRTRFRYNIFHWNKNRRCHWSPVDSHTEGQLCRRRFRVIVTTVLIHISASMGCICDSWAVTILRLHDMGDRESFIFCHHEVTLQDNHQVLALAYFVYVKRWHDSLWLAVIYLFKLTSLSKS